MSEQDRPELRSCLVCGAQQWRARLASQDYITLQWFSIFECNDCGLAVTSPLPQGHAIVDFYPRRYRTNRHGATAGLRLALRQLAVDRTMPRGGKGTLLDIGCGDGSFALWMKRAGWDVSATEIDPRTIDCLKARGVNGMLQDQAFSDLDRQFDIITCWHVLEHVEHPEALLEWARRILRPGGVFQVTVPNYQSHQSKLSRGRWFHLDVPRHRVHFAPSNLRSFLEAHGFNVYRMQRVAWEYDWLGAIQSPLNGICTRPNVLFESMTGNMSWSERRKEFGTPDLIKSYVGAAILAGGAIPLVLLDWMLDGGATLTAHCR